MNEILEASRGIHVKNKTGVGKDIETVTLSSINSIGCGHALAKLASQGF